MKHSTVERLATVADLKPPVRQVEPVDHAHALERVVEVLARLVPVLEPDAELERAGTVRHPVLLVQAEIVEEVANRRERGLTDADGGDPTDSTTVTETWSRKAAFR